MDSVTSEGHWQPRTPGHGWVWGGLTVCREWQTEFRAASRVRSLSLTESVIAGSPLSRRQSWQASPTRIYLDGALKRCSDMCTNRTWSNMDASAGGLNYLLRTRGASKIGKLPVQSGSFPGAGCRARGAIWPSGGTAVP